MAVEICLRIEDDGSFTVDQEDVQAEAGDDEGSGSGQKYTSLQSAISAIRVLAKHLGAPDEGGEVETGEPAADDSAGAEGQDEESQAMMQGFRPR